MIKDDLEENRLNEIKIKDIEEVNVEELKSLGGKYYDDEEYDKAIEVYEKAKELDEKESNIYIYLGNCYFMNEKYDKAIEYYKKAKELDEKNIAAYINLGLCYIRKEAYGKAREYYKKAKDLDGKNINVYIGLGNCYANKGEYNKAIEYYKKAKDLDEKDIIVYINLGVCYFNKTEYDEAIKYYKKAKELDEKDIRVYINLGDCYINKIEYDEALKEYEEIIEIDKKNDKPEWNVITNSYLELIDDKLNLNLEQAIPKYIEIVELYNEDLKRIMKGVYQENNKNDEEKKNIIELQALVMCLKRSLIYKDNADIAHYTKVRALKYLLKNVNSKDKEKEKYPKIRLNNADYMNDPEEGLIFIDLLKKIASNQDSIEKLYSQNINKSDENARKILNKNSNVFLTSFSKVIDEQIPMWVNYSDKATGCCILYNSGDFDKKTNHNTLKFKEIFDNQEQIGQYKKDTAIEVKNQKTYCLYNVKYFDKKLVKKNSDGLDKLNEEDKRTIKIIKRISEKINDILSVATEDETFNKNRKILITGILEEVRFLFKDKSYEYEEEVRLVEVAYGNDVKFTGDNEGHIVPHAYIEMEKKLKPKEVILGPKLENKNEVANYIYYTDEEIIVSESNIKYR